MRPPQDSQPAQRPRLALWDVGRLVMTVAVLIVGIAAFIEALGFRPRAAYFPLAASGIIIVGASVQLGLDLFALSRGRTIVGRSLDVESASRDMGARGLLLALRYLGWFVGFIVLLNAVGVFAAAMVFIAAFIALEARWAWWKVALITAATPLVVYLMLGRLELQTPPAYVEIGYGFLE